MLLRLPLTSLVLMVVATWLMGCPPPRRIVNDPNWIPPEDVRVVDDHIVIDNHINFELDSDVILPSSSLLLDNIADVIVHHPHIQSLRVIGHTDAAGGPAHNQDLSERRAASVVVALRQRGINITLDSVGRGERERLCTEDTPECHARNRRVEFLIVEVQ